MDIHQILDELGMAENDYLELIHDFIEQLEDGLNTISYNVDLNNFVQITKIARMIRQTATSLKLQDIFDITYQIELQAKSKSNLELIEQGVEELTRAFENLKEQYSFELV